MVLTVCKYSRYLLRIKIDFKKQNCVQELLTTLVKRSPGMLMEDVCSAVALKFFRSLKTLRLTFLRMRNKFKIINVQRNNKAFSV